MTKYVAITVSGIILQIAKEITPDGSYTEGVIEAFLPNYNEYNSNKLCFDLAI